MVIWGQPLRLSREGEAERASEPIAEGPPDGTLLSKRVLQRWNFRNLSLLALGFTIPFL
jgi:hypothetical protein